MAEIIITVNKEEQEEAKEVSVFFKSLKKNEMAYFQGLLEGMRIQQSVR